MHGQWRNREKNGTSCSVNRLRACLATFLAALTIAAATPPGPTSQDLDARVEQLLDAMSVEERVGQLFVTDFVGRDTSDASTIAQFISEYRIGGVVLQWTNNNIANDEPDTIAQLVRLNNGLQRIAYQASIDREGAFIPLFIALDHEGDGVPRTHIHNGATSIPSAMTIGATWNLDDAEAIGVVVGQELAAVGVNMLLGPVVDVLANPRPEGSGDINIRAFGGDPYWVGQMGRSYVRGVHAGSNGRVLTVAKHFPGHGASDRLPDDEVATVHRSLAELKQTDLIPFLEITRLSPDDPLGTTDAMMPSHIRYRGFQGDVNQLTRPISLDPAGMAAFMELDPLSEWRETGLVVCDSLGVEAIKSYYDPSLKTFPHKQIAHDALMAGNDLLPILSYSLELDWFGAQLSAMEETITYFQEQYRTNAAFQEQVNQAVRHILRAKLKLYPDLDLEEVLVDEQEALQAVGQGTDTVNRVVEHALTLLHPSPDELRVRLPQPPRFDQNILIAGCFEQCLPFPSPRLYADQVRDSLLRLYGPQGSDQVDPEQVTTLDYARLYKLLTDQVDQDLAPDDEEHLSIEEAKEIKEQIKAADWIILTLINYMPDTNPQTGTARLFLRSTDFDLRDKKIVAISFHAPYYLDATEISKLSAYWAVYSKVESCQETAWRALFQGLEARGSSPVSVEGISYDLPTQLSPAPAQAIRLALVYPLEAPLVTGADIVIETNPLVDRNGRTVRDGTVVRFDAYYPELNVHLSPRVVTGTVGGSAGAIFRPALDGELEIVARADENTSQSIYLTIAAAAAPTPTLASLPVPSPMAEAVVTSLPGGDEPTPLPQSIEQPPSSPSSQAGPIAAILTLASVAAFGLWRWRRSQRAGAATAVVDLPHPASPDETTVSVESFARPLVGQTLGSYQIQEKLGQGGMGQVYKAYHPLLDRTVAIKVLPSALVASEEMQGRFQQEARIAASLRHPNIVQVHDFGIQGDMIYMVMEYVAGQSLKERLKTLKAAGERMPWPEAIEIARHVADALAYAHAHGTIHRDVKPANILLTPNSQPILADFGLVILRGGPRYTTPGSLWGTPAYMAPELFDGQSEASERSDIYALGIVLYEMLVGHPPFEGESPASLIRQQTSVEPAPLRDWVPDLPEPVEAVAMHMLAKDPNRRYPTAADLAATLDELLEQRT
jgi:beta-N-acetylhexosaminidase